jgi:spore germination protein KC
MKRAACLLLVSAVLLTGCWNRTEVNDLAIVQCSAYDKDGDHYRVSVSFPLVSQMTGTRGGGGGTGGKEGQNNYVESADAEAIRTALANLQRKLSRRLYFAHRRVLLIGEEMARHGVSAILDNIARFPENRISTFVLVAEGSALQLMQTPVLMEHIPAEMFREILTTVMKSPVTAKDFIHAILTEGIDPYTLAFDRTETKTGDKAADTIAVHGLAVFRDDRLMGILDAKHLNGALLALDQLRRPVFSVKLPGSDHSVTAQFLQISSRLEPIVSGQDVRMRFTFSGMYEISTNESENALIRFEESNRITKAIEDRIRQEVSAAVKEIQTRFKADIFGFGSALWRNHPGVWRKVSKQWHDLYPQVPVEYRFDIRMEHVGTLNLPVHENPNP